MIVVLIVPVALAVPILEIVTGMLLGVPTTKLGEGCPIAKVKFGAGVACTGAPAPVGGAALLPVFAAGSPPPFVVALNTGVVPTVLAAAFTGIKIVVALFGETFESTVFEKQFTV